MAAEPTVAEARELMGELQQLFSRNKNLFFNTALSDPVIAWFQRMGQEDDFSVRNDMNGYMFTQMLLVTLNLSRRYIYDWFHSACVDEGQSWACQKLLSIVVDLDLSDTGLSSFSARFAACRALYERHAMAPEAASSLAETCLDVWREFHSAINDKVMQLGACFTKLMGTTWTKTRGEIMQRSTTFSGRHLQDTLAVAEASAKETFLFVNDVAVAMRSAASNLMLEQSSQGQSIVSLQANVEMVTTHTSQVQARCVELEQSIQQLMSETNRRLSTISQQQSRDREYGQQQQGRMNDDWQQQQGRMREEFSALFREQKDDTREVRDVVQSFTEGTRRSLAEFTASVTRQLDEVQSAFHREIAALRAEQARLSREMEQVATQSANGQDLLSRNLQGMGSQMTEQIVQQVRELDEERRVSSPVTFVSRTDFESMMGRYDRLIQALQADGQTQRTQIVRLDRKVFILHILLGAALALAMFGIILLSPSSPDPNLLT